MNTGSFPLSCLSTSRLYFSNPKTGIVGSPGAAKTLANTLGQEWYHLCAGLFLQYVIDNRIQTTEERQV